VNKNEIFDAFNRTFPGLKRNGYGAVLMDPPLRYATYDKRENVEARATKTRGEKVYYVTMTDEEIKALPIPDLLKADAAVFIWTSGTFLRRVIDILEDGYGLRYIAVAFVWIKADPNVAPIKTQFGMGKWTRANAEFVVMAAQGKPKRLNADIRQVIVEPEVIIEPRREHSRKPDISKRLERLLPGPHCELFARETHRGWDSWGDEVGKFDEPETSKARNRK
jgi:N6-adenosine-specific RNA methylase IME4